MQLRNGVLLNLALALVLTSGPAHKGPAAPKTPTAPHAEAPTVKPPAVPAAAEPATPSAEKPADETAKAEEPLKPTEEGKSLPPPAISRPGLCGELAKSGKELDRQRKKLEEQRKGIEEERQRLESLKAQIAEARIHLREETERLEGLLARKDELPKTSSADSAKAKTEPKTPLRPQDLDGLAKTMKSMKPEAAAALLQKTDTNLAAALLKHMKPAEAGAVIDRLKPDQAAELVTLMASMPSTTPKVNR